MAIQHLMTSQRNWLADIVRVLKLGISIRGLQALAALVSSMLVSGIIEAASLPGPHDCRADELSQAYTAGLGASKPDPSRDGTMTPCFQLLGYGGAEAMVSISKQGSVTYAPVFTDTGNGVLQTHDNGQTWAVNIPTFPDGGSHGRDQPYTYRDPDTGRLFFMTIAEVFGVQSGPGGVEKGFDMTYSDDDGATWHYSALGPDVADWGKIYVGPPVTSKLKDYPNVVYMSAPSPTSTPVNGKGPLFQAVYKSLDGGATWHLVSGQALSLKLEDVATGCEETEWVIYGNGVVGSDGTIYLSAHRCSALVIAVSKDEGASWEYRQVPNTTLESFKLGKIRRKPNSLIIEPLAIDAQDNLYLAFPDDSGLLKYSVSRDGAQTFSEPLVVSAPEVKEIVYGAIAVKEPGTVAVAYYGSTNDDGSVYHGFVAESRNALDATPRFEGALVSDVNDPLFDGPFDVGYVRLVKRDPKIDHVLNEIISVKYAPNGDIWVSLAKDMCPGLDAGTPETCLWDIGTNYKSHYQAAIGRLVRKD